MNTRSNAKITLHKYTFWLQHCFSFVCLCTTFVMFTVTEDFFLSVLNILVLSEMNAVTKMRMH